MHASHNVVQHNNKHFEALRGAINVLKLPGPDPTETRRPQEVKRLRTS